MVEICRTFRTGDYPHGKISEINEKGVNFNEIP